MKKKRKQNKRTRRRNKKLETLISKWKCFKSIVKNVLPNYKKVKNTQSEINPIKIGKRPGTTILHIILSHKK